MAAHPTAASATRRSLAPGRELLRTALALDAITAAVVGIAYLAASGPLADLLGIPATALLVLGAILVLFAAEAALLARATSPRRWMAWGIVAINEAWVAGSIVVLATGVWSLTTGGVVWVALQAVVIAAFAVVQAAALRARR